MIYGQKALKTLPGKKSETLDFLRGKKVKWEDYGEPAKGVPI
jgi:hypothetical protein